MFIVTIIATYLNRQGKVNLTGLIMVVAYSAGIMVGIASDAGRLSLQVAPLFTLLIIPELLAAALLSSGLSFVFAALYVAFGILAFMFMPRAVGINADDMNAIFIDSVLLPIILQGAVAGIALLWSSNLERALRERDRAEEVVRLERDLTDQLR